MKHSNLDILNSFDETALPDLDVCVLGALELFMEQPPPALAAIPYKHPLVVGSGNAYTTGCILFEDLNATFADESTYRKKLQVVSEVDGAVLVSASGKKHAVHIAKELQSRKIPTMLLTNNKDASAKEYVGDANTTVFPKNREPYTYNTSTYMSMIFAKTKENPEMIYDHIVGQVAPLFSEGLDRFDAFFFITPFRFDSIRGLFAMKFDELFGAHIPGRVFTKEQAKHGRAVISSDSECFVSFGEQNDLFGREENRLHIPLPETCGYGAMMAIGYYVIGQIQKHHPAYFKDNIIKYIERSSKLFGYPIPLIVE